jgi:hypothetical protein
LNEAQKAGIAAGEKDDNQVIQALFENKTKEVTVSEKEAESFYEANKEMVGGVPFEQVVEGIRQYMLQDKKQEAVMEYIDDLSESADLRDKRTMGESSKLISRGQPC